MREENNRNKNPKRIRWVDVAKGIGIILVVLGHICASRSVSVFIYSFHMPLFFFLSGYVFNTAKYPNYRSFLGSKICSIFLPFLYFNIVTLVFLPSQDVSGSFLFKIANVVFPVDRINVGVLWFLICLFLAQNIFYFILKLNRNMPVLALCLAGVFVLSIYELHGEFLWEFPVALMATFFLGVGFVFRKTEGRWKFIFDKRSIIFFLALNLLAGLANGRVDMSLHMYGNYLYFLISSFAGIAFCLSLSKILEQARLLAYLGQNTLPILAIHFLLVASINILFNQPFLASVAYTALILVFIIPIVEIINRSFPSIAGKQASLLASKRGVRAVSLSS